MFFGCCFGLDARKIPRTNISYHVNFWNPHRDFLWPEQPLKINVNQWLKHSYIHHRLIMHNWILYLFSFFWVKFSLAKLSVVFEHIAATANAVFSWPLSEWKSCVSFYSSSVIQIANQLNHSVSQRKWTDSSHEMDVYCVVYTHTHIQVSFIVGSFYPQNFYYLGRKWSTYTFRVHV